MSVKIRQYRNTDGWEIDISLRLPNGKRHRERVKAPVASKSGALRWGQDRERHLLQHGVDAPTSKKEVPTLEQFAERFITGYAVANQQKPSGIAAKRTILTVHLVPALGSKPLDAITSEDIQRLKAHLQREGRAPKTVNNILAVLRVLLKTAVDWNVIERMPCAIRQLRATKPPMSAWDFEEFHQLIDSAKTLGPEAHLIVLLGGDAGLRCGEMIALEWRDVDWATGQLCVRQSEWRGHVTAPKGGRVRHVPLTQRLASALRAHRHLRNVRVLCQVDGTALTQDMVGDHVRRAARRAGVPVSGAHRLRHTFCSHLAMRGAPARAIQEVAGHQDLLTTQRYMHLTPGAVTRAIRLLEEPPPTADTWRNTGDGSVGSR